MDIPALAPSTCPSSNILHVNSIFDLHLNRLEVAVQILFGNGIVFEWWCWWHPAMWVLHLADSFTCSVPAFCNDMISFLFNKNLSLVVFYWHFDSFWIHSSGEVKYEISNWLESIQFKLDTTCHHIYFASPPPSLSLILGARSSSEILYIYSNISAVSVQFCGFSLLATGAQVGTLDYLLSIWWEAFQRYY